MERLIEVARNMELEDEEADKLAKKIVTAYRKVDRSKEDIRLAATGKHRVEPKLQRHSEQRVQPRQEQPKVRQNKTIQQPKRITPRTDAFVPSRPSSAKKPNKVADGKPAKYRFREEQREYQLFCIKLICQKLTKLCYSVGLHLQKLATTKLKTYFKLVTEKENQFIVRRARKLMLKYFNLLAKETIILKIEKENQRLKRETVREKQQLETASDYHEYTLFKKAMKSWHRYVKQCRTEKENKRLNQIKQQREQKPVSQLKNKVSDLLATLKQDIEMADRQPAAAAEIIFEEEQEQSVDQEPHVIHVRPNDSQPEDRQEQNHSQPVVLSEHVPGKKLTHDELLKRRQELEKKNQDRKERLDKIRKEREQARLRQEQERKESQQLLKEYEARRKKDEYQKFLKRREQEKEAKERELLEQQRMEQLNRVADSYNRERIMKFNGWKPWLRLIALRNSNFLVLSQAVMKCHLKLYWLHFVESLSIHMKFAESKEQIKAIKAGVLHRRQCRRQILHILKRYRKYFTIEKQEFLVSRCMHLQKQVLRSWRRAMPEICEENYREEKKSNEKIQEVCFRALKDNCEEEKRQRLLAHHAKNLRGKILEWTKQDKPFDINNLLQ